MTRRLPRDIPPVRHRVKVRQTPVVRPYWLIVATAIINFGLCALALVLVAGRQHNTSFFPHSLFRRVPSWQRAGEERARRVATPPTICCLAQLQH